MRLQDRDQILIIGEQTFDEEEMKEFRHLVDKFYSYNGATDEEERKLSEMLQLLNQKLQQINKEELENE